MYLYLSLHFSERKPAARPAGSNPLHCSRFRQKSTSKLASKGPGVNRLQRSQSQRFTTPKSLTPPAISPNKLFKPHQRHYDPDHSPHLHPQEPSPWQGSLFGCPIEQDVEQKNLPCRTIALSSVTTQVHLGHAHLIVVDI